jgi:CubicO group peptidase (beta-lactamase class C family)
VTALDLTAEWPVPTVSATVVTSDGVAASIGDTAHSYRLASIAKIVTTWAVLVAVEEGSVHLDQAAGPPGSTLRHLLCHASGLPMDGSVPIAAVCVRRIYSNAGIEAAAALVETATGMAFEDYLGEAVLDPLGMTATELRGSPAHALWSTADDLARFAGELLRPRLLAHETAALTREAQFADLPGIVPGVGRFDPCPWALGCELRGAKSPHWTGSTNSPETFGHFGGAGTFLWVDPRRDLSLLALTDRPFDEWAPQALTLWPALSDAVLADPTLVVPSAASSTP